MLLTSYVAGAVSNINTLLPSGTATIRTPTSEPNGRLLFGTLLTLPNVTRKNVRAVANTNDHI